MEKLTGTIQPYAWGSTDAIASLLGVEPTGEPQAEYWLGAHAKAPSALASGPHLGAAIDSDASIVGAASVERFGRRLPYLMKVLSARHALSIQAHPSREQAAAGYAAENEGGLAPDAPHRNYRDDWPKPEAMVALTEFHGLCGFRDPERTVELIAALGVSELDDLVGPITERDGVARVFLEIVGLADVEQTLVDEVVAAAGKHTDDPGEVGELARTATELAADFPGDPGILVALLLNRITLQPGESFFMDAGNMHAYLRGTGIEIMSNSDNVLRGGLTGKHIDVDELAQIVDFTPGLPPKIAPEPVADGVAEYPTPAPEFALFTVDAAAAERLPAAGSGRIVLVTEGELTLRLDGSELTLSRGESAWVPAADDPTVHGTAHAFVAAPGIR